MLTILSDRPVLSIGGCVVSILALLATAPVQAGGLPLKPQAAPGVRVQIVARGLKDPRGLVFGPDDKLYVVEAGTTVGVFVPPPPPAPNEPPTRTRCEVYWPVGPKTPGYTGRISRIDPDGRRVVVARHLPSSAANLLIGGDRLGVAGVAFREGKLYAMVNGGGCSQGHPSEPSGLYRIYGDGSITQVADLYGAVREQDGDGDYTYSALTRHRDHFYVGTLGRMEPGRAQCRVRPAPARDRDRRRVLLRSGPQ